MLLSFILLGALQSQTRTPTVPTDVHVRLSLSRPHPFKVGQPIVVKLSFTADRPGYEAEIISSNPSSKGDDFSITPDAAVFHWLARLEEGDGHGRDYFNYEPLSARPVDVLLTLNDYVRFDARGDYTIHVTTHRVRDSRDEQRWLAVTSNDITIHVDAMSDDEEAEQTRMLRALIEATPKRDYQRQDALCHALGYLTGDAAARVKADLYIHAKPNVDNNCLSALSQGFLISQHPEVVLTAFEGRMADLSQPSDTGIVNSAAMMRGWIRTLGRAPGSPPDPATVRGVWPGRYDASRDDYLAQLSDSLTRRSGASRARTAATIMLMATPPLGPSPSPDVRSAIIEGFDDLEKYDQDVLVGSHWQEIRDPALAGPLERMIAKGIGVENAMHALLDVAADRAKPLIVAEILSPKPRTAGGALVGLPDEQLPEVDAPLLAQLRRMTLSPAVDDFWVGQKAQLIARYATNAIYDDVAALYRERGSRLAAEAQAPILVYLVKHNSAADSWLVEAVTAAESPDSFLSQVRYALDARSREAVARALIPVVALDDPKLSAAAVFCLREMKSSAGRDVVRARLERWMTKWRPRAAELEQDKRLDDEVQLQIELLSALRDWAATPEEKTSLATLCLTANCRALFAVR